MERGIQIAVHIIEGDKMRDAVRLIRHRRRHMHTQPKRRGRPKQQGKNTGCARIDQKPLSGISSPELSWHPPNPPALPAEAYPRLNDAFRRDCLQTIDLQHTTAIHYQSSRPTTRPAIAVLGSSSAWHQPYGQEQWLPRRRAPAPARIPRGCRRPFPPQRRPA